MLQKDSFKSWNWEHVFSQKQGYIWRSDTEASTTELLYPIKHLKPCPSLPFHPHNQLILCILALFSVKCNSDHVPPMDSLKEKKKKLVRIKSKLLCTLHYLQLAHPQLPKPCWLCELGAFPDPTRLPLSVRTHIPRLALVSFSVFPSPFSGTKPPGAGSRLAAACIYFLSQHACSLCWAESLSRVRLFATPWTVAHQAPLPMGILQARILEWVAMPSSTGYPQPRDQTQVSCIGRQILCHLSHQGSLHQTRAIKAETLYLLHQSRLFSKCRLESCVYA